MMCSDWLIDEEMYQNDLVERSQQGFCSRHRSGGVIKGYVTRTEAG